MHVKVGVPRQIVSLWIGPELGDIERLSLTSFLTHGHPVALYAYDDVRGVPDGVEVRDAGQLLSRALAEQHRYANGSYALFSNYFRFLMLRAGLGLWVDSDVICMKPITQEGFVAGWESDDYVNGAVLGFEADSQALADLISAYEAERLPEWIPWHRAPAASIKRAFGLDVPPNEQPHGTYGPKGVSAICRRHGLLAEAQPTDVFYPLHPRNAERLYAPGSAVAEVETERTLTIHLWNEKLRTLRQNPPPRHSMLGELFRRYGV